MPVSAYTPCHNAGPTIRDAVKSLLGQSRRPDEIFVVDDGSTDGLPEMEGVRIVRLKVNRGRGSARTRAMQEAKFEFVLGCDSSLVLDRDFLSLALPWFDGSRKLDRPRFRTDGADGTCLVLKLPAAYLGK
jgi:glycosyltransferase involved in cell wall biosynthesis